MQTAQIIPFQFESKEIRAYSNDAGEPWFCAADVCKALGYANSRKAIADNCREKGVTSSYTLTSKGKQALTFINEGNLYRLIIKSRKEEAQRFEAWVCDEVLPAIRKHGSYADTENKMGTLIGETIGTNGFNMLGSLIKGKVVSLPAVSRAKATAKIWSQTHAAFGVRCAADIPASQLDAARNFIAAYALEGEWLPKQAEAVGVLTLDVYQANSLSCLLHYSDWVNHRWHQGISDAVKALNPDFYSHTWEFFREMRQSAKQLESSPEIAALCKTGNAKRPHECSASTLAV